MIASLLTLPPLLVYASLFALIAGESAGLPLPGETSLIAAGALAAHHGRLSIAPVIAVAATAAIVGDNVGFALGRRGGRWLLTRDGRWASARRRYLERGERFFARHGAKAVFLARWVPGLRVVGAWLAGTHHMRWRSFLLWNALGGVAWALSVGIAGYLLGQAAGQLFRTLGLAAAGALVAVLAVTGLAMAIRRQRRRRRTRPDLDPRARPEAELRISRGSCSGEPLDHTETAGRAGPVLLEQLPTSTAENKTQRDRHQDRVVELTHDRHEVGHEIEREREVPDEAEQKQLVPAWQSGIASEPCEEHRTVGNEPHQSRRLRPPSGEQQRRYAGHVDSEDDQEPGEQRPPESCERRRRRRR